MKKLIIFLMGLISISSLSAQRIVTDEIDKFNGDRIVETNIVRTGRPMKTHYQLRQINDSLFMCLYVKNIKRIEIKQDSVPLILLMRSGDKINLTGEIENMFSKERNQSIHWGAGITTGGAKKLTSIIISAYIPEEILTKLCVEDIIGLRISLGNINIDKSLEYKYHSTYKNLRQMFNLMRDQK
jgi:hypothetical protein|nr:MAG TPA: hypothetical protein [Bacteriophage sp.]